MSKDATADFKTISVDIPGSEAITAAIAAGHILVRKSAVLVKELKTKLMFEDRIPVTLAGAAALVGGSVDTFTGTAVDQIQAKDDAGNPKVEDGLPEFKRSESVVGLFYYGHNLVIRNYVRTKFLNETAAPEKKDEARIKMLQGLGYSREDAERMVREAPGRTQATDEAPAEPEATATA